MSDRDQRAPRSRDLGEDRPIPRRDFLQGALIGAATALCGPLLRVHAGESGADTLAAQDQAGYYPPAADRHARQPPGLLRGGARAARRRLAIARRGDPTAASYDLVVVGGGISGLAAAHFFRARHGRGARILILDNHDDFGGHAKRNEFHVGGGLQLHQRRHAGDRQPAPLQRRRRRPAEDAGHRSGALDRQDATTAVSIARLGLRHAASSSTGRPSAPTSWSSGRGTRRSSGAAGRRRRCRASARARHRAHRGGDGRLPAGADLRREERAAVADELPRDYLLDLRQGRSAASSPSYQTRHARRMGRRHRCRLGARLLGATVCPGFQRLEA